MRARFIHYVASFRFDGNPESRASGIVDVPKGHSPEEVHDHIQISFCKKMGLSVDDFREDVVVEKMEIIQWAE
ncbi:hypothetical protein DIBBI_gp63 [Xanthomonas phage vB_XveM_DIBBI]|uniref:Uncharacterized protein n=1 Tax=Xanthomonas phage vB_XveM_DIBBI TaxID=1129194 RepID=I3PGZ6_9CAUD|nr:hypothetical protein DIBBI_gp63 [Xanthomonas phage vB_XveM_DIBBI]AEX65731.1 hypothetical protein DIBBI_063 [Xanthomonas phage vB_XveM_DIBBI]